MAVFNSSWDRWIMATLASHFNSNKPATLPMFIEGEERNTNTLSDFFELRVDGPSWLENCRDDFKGTLEINVLLQVKMDDDLYRINRRIGQVTEIFTSCIAALRLGPDVGDDGLQFGTLIRSDRDGRSSGIRSHKYGQIEPDIRLLHATVEATYEIRL